MFSAYSAGSRRQKFQIIFRAGNLAETAMLGMWVFTPVEAVIVTAALDQFGG